MAPAALVNPRGETSDRGFRDDVKCSSLADVPCRAIDPIEQVRAAGTWQLPLGSIHEAIQYERVVRSEQIGHFHLLRRCVLAYSLEYIVLLYLATERQGTALGGYSFNLGTKCDLVVQKRV